MRFFPFLPFSLSFLLHSPPLLFISDSRPIHVSSVSSPRASRPCPLSPPLLLLRIFTCPPPLPAHRGRQHSNTPYGLKNHCFVCHVVFLITFVITGTRVPGRYLVKNLGNFSPRVTGTALLLRLTPWHGKCCGGTGLVAML